ncbi:MAG: TatD family hydrolase [Lachnospiraceae bacterium]|nr:TatD family hydrolase [Lachnospiraceae bacterium]
MFKIFDTHAHYDDEAFDEDRDEIIASLKENGICAVTNIGSDLKSSRNTLDLIKKYDFFYGAVGVHPSEVGCLEEIGDDEKAIDEIRKMALSSDRVVAIGEIGLDYHYEDTNKELQQKWFRKQLRLARELNLPVVIHSRDAVADTIVIMENENAREVGGVIHCYSYTERSAMAFKRMGFYLGVGGVVTFSNGRKLKDTVKYIPLTKLVMETDCPYLAPQPYRGKRNNSTYLNHVAEAIAEIKELDIEDIYEEIWNNSLDLYRLRDKIKS